MRADICFRIVLFGLFALGYLLALSYPQRARQFPDLIALGGMALLFVSFVIDGSAWLRGRRPSPPVAPDEEFDASPQGTKRYYQAWLVIVVATAAGLLGGFLFTAVLILVGFPLVLDRGDSRKLARRLTLAFVLTGCVYLVFDYFMEVPLLEGLLLKL